jgi:ATP/maltotriose-dependent transcriptional regulator MalT
MVVHEELLKAVDAAVTMPESEGFVDVLKALAELMSNNRNPETKKAAKAVAGLAEVLNDYLAEPEEEEDY